MLLVIRRHVISASALLDHSIYPIHWLRLQRRQRVKEFVRRSFFQQPLTVNGGRRGNLNSAEMAIIPIENLGTD